MKHSQVALRRDSKGLSGEKGEWNAENERIRVGRCWKWLGQSRNGRCQVLGEEKRRGIGRRLGLEDWGRRRGENVMSHLR